MSTDLTRMRTTALCLSLLLISVAASSSLWAKGTRRHTVTESFPDHRPIWKHSFFYRWSNAESYYFLTGSRADIRPNGQHGLWLAIRGVHPSNTPKRMRLRIKPGLGQEISYISFGLNSHLFRTTVSFYDKRGRRFAVSCVPRTGYYVYTQIAVPIRNGLSAIVFDGHGGQVPGNININDVSVTYGKRGSWQRPIIHELSNGQCVDLVGPIDANKRYRPAGTR